MLIFATGGRVVGYCFCAAYMWVCASVCGVVTQNGPIYLSIDYNVPVPGASMLAMLRTADFLALFTLCAAGIRTRHLTHTRQRR